MNRPATFHTVKHLPLFAIVFLSGCQTQYTRITVRDFENQPMVEWIAEGRVKKVEQGYSISAVQRTSGGAYPKASKYPNGWRTTVTGPNIVKQPVDKPDWLAGLDRDPAPAPVAK